MTSIFQEWGIGMRNDFTLFYRVVPSGKKVVYYYAYNEDGERLGPWTTGETTKTAARNYCHSLIRKGVLVPGIKGMTTFAVYAAEFWDWGKSEYLKDRKKRRKLTQSYTDRNHSVVNHTLVPYFGKMRLDRITGEVIDKWLDFMIAEKDSANERRYENVTINGYFGTLQTMMRWAAKKRYIVRDPFLDVQKLVEEQKEKKLITKDEFDMLFLENWRKVWNDDLLMCTANKLMALTGMRVCEVLGLKGEYVYDGHIFVCAQHDTKYGYRPTKTKTQDNIPLTEEMIRDLGKLKAINGNGYIFSLDGGEKPVTDRDVYYYLDKALVNIGISTEERKKRGINVHAWRHFCNTELLNGGVPLKKVQAVTRHKSERMTERYTHFNPLEFTEVLKVQDKLLKKKPKKKETPAHNRPALTLIKMPEDKKPIQQIKAS